MRELSQRNGRRVLNVGGLEVGGSFMEPQDHAASELWLYVKLGEKEEFFVHYITTLFKGHYFSAQMGGLSTKKTNIQNVSIFLRHEHRNDNNVKPHFSLCLMFAIPHIPLCPLLYFFTSYSCSSLYHIFFFKTEHDLVMF